jgi:SNF2 family DNA or RNA helicase
MRALRCASSEDERNKLHELLATWGNLEVVPRAYFVVGGRECEAQEFLSAAKVGDSYVFPWGAAIAEPTYQRHLESYLTRKKALVRLGHLTMAKLGALSSFLGFRPVSSSTNPMEYIRSLELCWSSESRALETALVQRLESFLSSGQADAGFEILRPYQRNGVAWIVARWMQGLGACLADEMGLGKTVQTICALRAYRVATEGQGRDSARAHPHLVVCPKSVLDVWARECARFAPEFAVKVVRQAGELEANQLQGVDIVVTTYARVRQSLMHFSQKPWGTLVLDEAQTIKNAATATAEALRTIPCDHRLALTGTPIENHAGELWSIVDWLNPGWLGKSHDFQAFTRMARDPEVARMSLSPIHEALRPILLRRLKTTPGVDVALPPKTYHTIAYTPAPEQLDVYSVLIEIAVSQSEELSQFKAAACFLRTILLARKLLNHPRCFYVGDEEDALVTHDDADRELQSRLISLARTKGCQGRLPTTSPSSAASNQRLAALTAPSGKLTALAELLENLSCASGGVLIFTQFHSSADLVREVARELSPEAWADVPYLHGGTTTEQRNAMVAAFQDKCASRDANVDAASAPAPLLVVSLRAGGTGITLTGARSVVHFDRWWNPAVEAQATDRAHRIGQKNAVTVYTFEAPATLDESLTRMHESKRSLADDLLGLSSAGQASQFLRGPEGFLELMDPQGLFQARVLGALGQRSSSSVRMADA